jgi:hypothetical protein
MLDRIEINGLTVIRVPKSLELPVNLKVETMRVTFNEVGKKKQTWGDDVPLVNGALDAPTMVSMIRAKALDSDAVKVRDTGEIVVVTERVVGWWSVSEDDLQKLTRRTAPTKAD